MQVQSNKTGKIYELMARTRIPKGFTRVCPQASCSKMERAQAKSVLVEHESAKTRRTGKKKTGKEQNDAN